MGLLEVPSCAFESKVTDADELTGEQKVVKRGFDFRFPAACAALSLCALFLPLGFSAVSAVVTHVGLLAFLFGLLLYAYADSESRKTERILAFVFTLTALLATTRPST